MILLGKCQCYFSDFTYFLFYIKTIALTTDIEYEHRCDTLQVNRISDPRFDTFRFSHIFSYYYVSLFLINIGFMKAQGLGAENILDYLCSCP